MTSQSLRARLIVIILTPLLAISIVAAIWQFRNTTTRAADIFDRGLLSAALAISRDVAISDGDALSPSTRRLVSDTSGGEVFYHVYAPDGVFVTGYATPPPAPFPTPPELTDPLYYNALYKGRDVRVLRFQYATTIDGVTGLFTISVWQDLSVRTSFVQDVLILAIGVISLLLLSVALIVWFGVGLGLRPLLDLQTAIARRTPSDLEPIRRNVPIETQGIVSTLNELLDRVSRRISSKDEFISNAAHQLRNPIAGVLALAEAVESAPSPEAAKLRSTELVAAARDATHLTNQLLSFERAKGSDLSQNSVQLDLVDLLRKVIERFEATTEDHSAKITLSHPPRPVLIIGDEVMLQEAFLNLLTNAVVHGGSQMSKIDVTIEQDAKNAILTVEDNGIGIESEMHTLAKGRFSQANSGRGSGLGLPIAFKVIENHGGQMSIEACKTGARLKGELPLMTDASQTAV